MKKDEYRTIKNEASGLYKEKGSKFIALAFPVEEEETVKRKLEEVRKQYHDARHHCYAYRLGYSGNNYRINDDGEPSGTAGKPIFGQIMSKEMTNVLVIVVRYFGGTKLGVSGLINAYRTAARDALEQASAVKKTVNDCYRVLFDYPVMNAVMRIVKEYKLDLVKQEFEMKCMLVYSIRREKSPEVFEKFSKLKGVKIEDVDIC
jgi:uncharacterized YigZ family protein